MTVCVNKFAQHGRQERFKELVLGKGEFRNFVSLLTLAVYLLLSAFLAT